MLLPAALSILVCETSAVDPKPSAGTRPLTIVGARRVLEKFVAASFDSIARRISLPPATFLPCDGTTYGSPAAARSPAAGSFGLEDTVGSGAPVMSNPDFVAHFISFSIQPPDG